MPPSEIPQANVLGVRISAVNMAESLQVAEAAMQGGGGSYICVTGVHGVMEAQRDPALKAAINQATLTLPDGMPTVWVGRAQGHSGMERVVGPEFMERICALSVRKGYTHFLYGGNTGVAEELATAMRRRWPGIQVVGTYTPPFRPLTRAEEEDLTRRVAEARPDVFWVGLSTPKQERFMAAYHERLACKLMVGVGAAFDYHTGRIKDSPAWVQQIGMQWFHRLLQEPRRLWRRYLTNNPKFLLYIGLQLLHLRQFD